MPSGARATAARATMDALADSPDVFEEFFVSARIGLALADLNGSYVRVNRTYAELLGKDGLKSLLDGDVERHPEPRGEQDRRR